MPKARTRSFGDNLRRGTGYRGEQPVKTSFARNEFDFPDAVLANKLIMPLGDTQDFVYRLDPFPSYPLLSEHPCKYFSQGGAEPPGFQEQSFRGLRVGLRQALKLSTALGGDNIRRFQKVDKTFPIQFNVRRSSIGKIERESASQQGYR